MAKNATLKKTVFLLLLTIIFSTILSAGDKWDNLAKTPPMGWNSWNKFQCNVSEKLIMETADAMVSSGMKEAGYDYIVIDDCWQIGRDEEGNIIPDPERFPNGMKAVGDYIHSKGLKFGLYTDAGLKTCEGRPASRGYEFQDFRQYAKWGVDYTKVDWCYAENQNALASFSLIRDAIKSSGRPMVLSICEWGFSKPWLWGEGVGHLWRTTLDIEDCWDCSTIYVDNGKEMENFLGFTKILDLQVGLEIYAGPGHWNDPDMLQVGNEKLTYEENKAHFSLWCILAAPLMSGNDLRNMSPEITAILTNKEVIAIDQDPLGKQGVKIRDDGDFEVWSKQLSDGSRAVVLFNRSESSANMTVNWNEIGYPNHLKADVRDLWKKKDMGSYSGKYSAEVPVHGVVLIKIQP